jgi:hypothetical protein
MNLKEMYPSKYLKKEDFPAPRTFTVKMVCTESIKSDNGNENKPILYFQELPKGMVLNRGNGDILGETYGYDTDLWVGKPVEVYVDPSVMFGGKRVGGLRLRPPGNFGAPSNGAKRNPPGAWTWEQAVAEAEKAGIVKDSVVSHLKAKGHAGWNGQRDTPVILDLIREVQAQTRGDAYEGHTDEIPFAWLAMLLLPFLGMMS